MICKRTQYEQRTRNDTVRTTLVYNNKETNKEKLIQQNGEYKKTGKTRTEKMEKKEEEDSRMRKKWEELRNKENRLYSE